MKNLFLIFALLVVSMTAGAQNQVTCPPFTPLNGGIIAPPSEFICYGETPQLFTDTLSPSGGSGNYSYLWQKSVNHSTWTNLNGFTLDYQSGPLTTTTEFRRAVIDAACPDTAYTGSIVVIVYALPTVTATNSGPYCENQTINLSSTLGFTSYLWSGPNGFVSNVQNPHIDTARIANAGRYTVTATDGYGCSNTANTDVFVRPLPAIIANNTGPYCANQTAFLFSTAGMSSYLWSGPNGFGSNVQNPSINNVTTAADGVYSLRVYDSNNCSNTATTTMVVHARPAVTASNGGPYCAGDTVRLSSTIGFTNYLWSGPNGFVSNVQNPSINNSMLTNAGIYTVTVTDLNNCQNTASSTVSINPLPNATISGTSSICRGTSTTLTTGLGGSYEWNTGATTQSINVSPSTDTQYSVTVTNGGCHAFGTTNVIVHERPSAITTIVSANCATLIIDATNLTGGNQLDVWATATNNISAPSVSGIRQTIVVPTTSTRLTIPHPTPGANYYIWVESVYGCHN